MIYKVGLLGASGRIGLEIAAILHEGFRKKEDQFELSDAVTGSGRLVSIEGVQTRRIDEPARELVHVWIDFSSPEATLKLLETTDTPILIATTGFTDEQLKAIEKASTERPVLLASNTSIGMNVMLRLLQSLPKSLPFDVTLHEEHHKRKKDKPSGTAKTILKTLDSVGYGDVPTTVVRAGDIRGIHTVRLVGADEIVELRHEALDRKIFAQGALEAAAFLVKQKKPGMYTMGDVLLGEES